MTTITPNFTSSLIAFSLLAGCADALSVPVTGIIGETPAQGEATAKLSGVGTFSVATLDGLTCGGTYDSFDTSPTISTLMSCSDGRTGNLIITRTLDMLSGTVIGKLSDGTSGRFVFGNLSYEQAFGGGTSTTVLAR